jgi:hypothetical protein
MRVVDREIRGRAFAFENAERIYAAHEYNFAKRVDAGGFENVPCSEQVRPRNLFGAFAIRVAQERREMHNRVAAAAGSNDSGGIPYVIACLEIKAYNVMTLGGKLLCCFCADQTFASR